MKMLLTILAIVLMTGCYNQPKHPKNPKTIPIKHFKKFKEVHIQTRYRVIEKDGNTEVYIITKAPDFVKLLTYTKNVREAYNSLVEQIKEYNKNNKIK